MGESGNSGRICTSRFERARRLELFRQVARGGVIRGEQSEFWGSFAAEGVDAIAARVEAATRRRVLQAGRRARDAR